MPQSVGTVTSTLLLDTKPAVAAYRKFEQQVARSRGRDNLFGSISADAKDFENSLGKATNRVVAFGAAAAVFATLSKAATSFAQSIVEVDNSLSKINVNLNQTQAGLNKFSNDLFDVARQTGQTFEVAAKGAEELARQGLGAEETIERLQKALILSRIAGIDSASAVETLTAAINSFNEEALTASEVVNKFAAVDTKFAVSSKDLAEAVSRVGSTAQSAGVGIDELIGLVTSLQQTTARGGATIGNGLKTIFTRIQAAPETVEALEGIGVAIKNTDGSLRDAISVLTDYSRAREKVGEVERASLDRTVAGTFQINVLKALLTDLNKEYSIYGNAVKTAANATDEAIRKNQKLNETLSSLLNSTQVSIKEFLANLGSQQVGPLFSLLLKGFEEVRSFLSGDSGSSLGKGLGEGLLKGISSVLSGPALGAIVLILSNAVKKVITTIATEAKTLLAINNAAQARANIQRQIIGLLQQSTAAERAEYEAASGVLAKKEQILAIQARINQETLIGTALTNSLLTKGTFGIGSRVDKRISRGSSYLGGIPNFAKDPINDAINREKMAGIPSNQIYVDRDARIANFANPKGLLVANRRDEPLGGFQGVDRVLGLGESIKAGKIPNFAKKNTLKTQAEIVGQRFGVGDIRYDNVEAKKQADAKAVSAFDAAIKRSTEASEKLEKKSKKLSDTLTLVNKAFSNFNSELQKQSGLAQYDNPIGPSFGNFVTSRVNKSSPTDSLKTPSDPNDPSTKPQNVRLSEIALLNRQINNRAQNRSALSSSARVIGPAFPINPQLLAKLQARDQEVRFANAGISPTSDAYSSPIGPPTYQQNRSQRLVSAFQRGAKNRKTQQAVSARRQQRVSNATLAGSFALPLIGGFAEPLAQSAGIKTGGGTPGGIATGAISLGTQVAGFGALTGNPAIAAGAGAIGALIGAFLKLKKSTDEIVSELEDQISTRQRESEAISRAIQLQEELNNAIKEGADQNVVEKLDKALRDARGSISSSSGRRVLDIRDPQLQAQAASERQDELSRQNAGDVVKQLLLNKNLINQFSSNKVGVDSGNEQLASAIKSAITETQALNPTDDQILNLQKIAARNFDVQPTFRSGFASSFTNEKFLDNGEEILAAAQEFKKVAEIIAPLAGLDKNQITKDNVNAVALALVRAIAEKRGDIANSKAVKDARESASGRLLNNSFLSQPNTDVYRNVAFNNRNPASNNGLRAQSKFDFFNELSQAGGIGKELLETNPEFKKARAGVQSKNIGDLAISFLQGNNSNVGNLRDSRGDANFGSIERVLDQIAKSGSQNAEYARLLLDVIKQRNRTATDLKINTPGRPIENGPNFSSGFTLGQGYSTFAGNGKAGKQASFITKDDLVKAQEKDGNSFVKMQSLIDRNNRNNFDQSSRYDLIGGPTVKTIKELPNLDANTPIISTVKTNKNDLDINADLPITATVKTLKEITDTTQASLQTAQTIASTPLQVNVQVQGFSDPNISQQLQEAISKILGDSFSAKLDQAISNLSNEIAASKGKPNPPKPTR